MFQFPANILNSMNDFPNGYNAILGRPNMYFSYAGAVFRKHTVVLYPKVRLSHKPIKIGTVHANMYQFLIFYL